jgi:hypothetical protein
MMTLRAECFGDRIPVGARDFSVLRNVQIVTGAHLYSDLSGTGVLSRETSGSDVKLTTHLHLLPGIRMPSWLTYGNLCLSTLRVHNFRQIHLSSQSSLYIWKPNYTKYEISSNFIFSNMWVGTSCGRNTAGKQKKTILKWYKICTSPVTTVFYFIISNVGDLFRPE